MRVHKAIALCLILSMLLASCGGNRSGSAGRFEPPIASEEGFGVQDLWVFHRILHVDSDGRPANILPIILENAKRQSDQRVTLPGGATFTPISNLPAKLTQEAANGYRVRDDVALVVGFLENEDYHSLAVLTNFDLSQAGSNVDFGDSVGLDFENFPGLEAIQIGDSLLSDFTFGQTLTPDDPVSEAGMTSLEVFAARVNRGALQWMGIVDEESGDTVQAVIVGFPGAVVQGSVLGTVAKKGTAILVGATVGAVEGGKIGAALGALITSPLGGEGALPGWAAGALGGAFVTGLAVAAENIVSSFLDDTAPVFTIIAGDSGCNIKDGYGYANVWLFTSDYPLKNDPTQNITGLNLSTVINRPLNPPEGVNVSIDSNPVLSNSFFVVYPARLTNSNDAETFVTMEMRAKDKNGNDGVGQPQVRVPGRDCVEQYVDLWGIAWHDKNGDGLRQEDEPPLPNLRIQLRNTDIGGGPIAETKTDANGRYRFDNVVRRDNYYIEVARDTDDPYHDWVLTYDDMVSLAVFDELDSDIHDPGTTRNFDLRLWPRASEIWGADIGMYPKDIFVEIPSTPTATPVQVGQLCPPSIDVTVSVASDPSGHREFIGMPGSMQLTTECGSITISGTAPWVTVRGEIDEQGNFSATGTGTVAGYGGIEVSMQGTLQDSVLDAHYSMGVNGGLPGGQAIIYTVQGQAPQTDQSTPVSTASPSEADAVRQFAALLENYNHTANADGLVAILHPAIVETYGDTACLSHAADVADTTLDINVISVYKHTTWEFALDGVEYSIPDVYAVDAFITRNGESNATQTHFGLVGDQLYWFTDCGDPLP